MSTSPTTPSRNPEQILRRLEWTVLRRLDGLLHGDYRTIFRGFGLDLADLREYQYHDDVRHIDWNVTARLQVPYVREYHEDREIAAWFLVDLSPSVDFGSGQVRKRSVALDFVAVLARLLTRRGNRVGLMSYGTKVESVIQPRGGRRHVLHLMSRMMAVSSATPAAKGPRGQPTDLRELLRAAHEIVKRRSLVFVVSDFISVPGWDQPLAKLAQRNEVVAIRLYDPLEMELPDLGLVLMQDSETGEQIYVDTNDKRFRKRFAAAAEKREAQLREGFFNAGIDALELATEDDLADALMRFADLRKRRSNLTQGGRLPAHLEGRRVVPVA
jgi:uncharacterized protein (DUF58 family)